MPTEPGWFSGWFANGWFPPVWFAPGDESHLTPEELVGGWAPPWQFIAPRRASPPQRPAFNEDEDTSMLLLAEMI
jgi:hypothetical protein